MEASIEQINIARCIEKGDNLIVSAVPGSGKSTVILSTTVLCSDKLFLSLTYNASLKVEIRKKVLESDLNNIIVHSYHSLCVNYYDINGHTDIVINTVIKTNKRPIKPLPKINVISIDECQDMNSIYYQFIKKFIHDLTYQPTIVLLGDEYQDLYTFKNADKRYLLLGHSIWKSTFNHLTLSKTYRLTNNITKFVNQVLIGCNRITSYKDDGEKVMYIKDNDNNACNIIIKDIIKLLKNNIILPNDIFVLAASTKSRMLKLLENKFVMNNIGCYVSTESNYDIDVVNNKAIFTTFHQSKGMEKKVVIIVGHDNSYFKYYGKTLDTTICPSALYVGVTRASYKLYVIENKSEGILPFLHMDYKKMKLSTFIDFKGKIDNSINTTIKSSKEHHTTVEDLVKFLSIDCISKLHDLLLDIFVSELDTNNLINIPTKVSCNEEFEDVSNLNVYIITSFYEYTIQNTNTIYNLINNSKVSKYPIILDAIKSLTEPKNIYDFTKMCILYHAVKEKLYFKLEQIINYDWITNNHMNQCIERLTPILSDNSTYQVPLKYVYDLVYEIGNVHISGTVDVINDNLILLKCTDTITLEHKLQLIIYTWLYNHNNNCIKDAKIFNINTGELLTLNYSSKVCIIIELLLRNKYQEQFPLNDLEFIKQCN